MDIHIAAIDRARGRVAVQPARFSQRRAAVPAAPSSTPAAALLLVPVQLAYLSPHFAQITAYFKQFCKEKEPNCSAICSGSAAAG